jgi:endonuclease YncB( thermonuclease family)
VTVSDGDTMTVLDAGNSQHKIWLAGIDAPLVSDIVRLHPGGVNQLCALK